ncbi:hypothetical protein [Euzebya pacifica]|uniref:hypothetical protein n=1 Tax=Euzebya pacifica TaxID=1608957 RepID=UPI001C1FA1DF|nr:hypothetical protein [Euzebya pacifica]
MEPEVVEAARRVVVSCSALPDRDEPPAGFVEVADGLVELFEDPVWESVAAFRVEVAAGNLAVVAADWAHGRLGVDGDPWEKRLSAVRGGLLGLDVLLDQGQ